MTDNELLQAILAKLNDLDKLAVLVEYAENIILFLGIIAGLVLSRIFTFATGRRSF